MMSNGAWMFFNFGKPLADFFQRAGRQNTDPPVVGIEGGRPMPGSRSIVLNGVGIGLFVPKRFDRIH